MLFEFERNMESLQERIVLFSSLFKGRQDVFAVHWEKGDKKGFMPAIFYDPYVYRKHQMNGGTFQNFKDKSYLKLTEEQLIKHFEGQQLIGIYPLLPDNSSWFIAADFDKKDWLNDSNKVIQFCNELGVPAYAERSRSGNGCHVWIFFKDPYPAYKSRKLLSVILERCKVVSVFDKNASFDRLFPNQDYLSGKGLGNLIALPFYGTAMANANSCFIDTETAIAYTNQWSFLKAIKRISTAKLDQVLADLLKEEISVPKSAGLTITLNNMLRLNKGVIPSTLIQFLKEELNFLNVEFHIRKNSGKNTFGTERYFQFIEDNGNEISIPRGFTGKLLRFCKERSIEYTFNDQRKLHDSIQFTFYAQLKDYQQPSLLAASKKNIGVIVAPPGSGKTVIGLSIIAEKQQPALLVVHRKQLLDQWTDRIETFLGIPRREIGKITSGKVTLGKQITIATIQSLGKAISDQELIKAFGIIIVDECHHIPAKTFRETLGRMECYYLYGLTATPFRKYNDGKLIFIHLGEVISEIQATEITTRKNPEIIIRNTLLDVPYNSKTDRFETLSKILIHDSERNRMLLDDVAIELNDGRKAVILTERKEHIDTLNQYMKQTYETITLSGDDTEAIRAIKWKSLKEGNFQLLITTGQLFGEGTDLHHIECLFLAYPFSFEGKLVQYIGRVQRAEIVPMIYDYRDIKIDYLNRMFLKRNTFYNKLAKQVMLFDELGNVESEAVTNKEEIIDKYVRIPVREFDFQYGALVFKYQLMELNRELDIEIENTNIRPELEVLKPYFEKQLKSKAVMIHIQVVIRDQEVIALSANSRDLDRFNSELIESMRFSFIEKNFFGKRLSPKQSKLDQESVNETNTLLYESGEDLLESVLDKVKYLHHRELVYLSGLHEGALLKIRFVLSPFAFVFLLKGQEQYHIILETLDTEEATYIWHLSTGALLEDALNSVNKQINMIRTEGRQAFLKTEPINFSRVQHDYSDSKKSFIVWKDALTERLI